MTARAANAIGRFRVRLAPAHPDDAVLLARKSSDRCVHWTAEGT
ncbi:hypothetical protein ACLMNJ_15400 [Streptomyces seoulensis]